MTQTIALLGYPLGHSISPVFQQAGLDALHIDAKYEAWHTPPEKLAETVAKLRGSDYLGCNVTVPHKEHVVAMLDHVDPSAASVGAVNTIVNKGGKLSGYNTDSEGFARALERQGKFMATGRKVLLLGAGGAARGVVLALSRLGVAHLSVANRTADRAKVLVELAASQQVPGAVVEWNDAALAAAARTAHLIVNTTTLGMAGGPNPAASPLPASSIPYSALVYDLVYNPRETPLLKAANQAGARTLDGLPMLVYQGAAAFTHWTGKPAPTEAMLKAAEAAMAARQGH